MKILSFLAPFISKIKTADIFNFLSVKYFGKGLLFLKIWHIRVNYCWSYGPSNLLFRFFRYRLGHLDNRQTKIAENSKIHFFESQHQSKCLLKVSSSLTHPPQNGGPLNFLRNWTDNHILMANFSKLRQYQTFVLIELSNMSKDQLADRIFKLWKSCVYNHPGSPNIYFLKFCNIIFLFLLKIESVGPVDQQINLVSPKYYGI